jgi:hypothetical protein
MFQNLLPKGGRNMKQLSVIIGLTLVAILIFTTTPIQAKDNPSNSTLCAGLIGKAKGICTAAVAKGCDKRGNQLLQACIIHEDQYYDLTEEKPPWIKRLVRVDMDNNNDGSIESVSYRFYDEDGNLWKMEMDSDKDGDINSTTYYTYNEEGKLIQTKYDFNNDENIDRVDYWIYDAHGNYKIEVDNGNNETIDEVIYYTFDKNGKVIKYARDYDNDGEMDYITYSTNYYDKNKNLIKVEANSDEDPDIDSVTYYFYDEDGKLTKYETDTGNDDSINMITKIYYDADGYRIRQEVDLDGDGEIEYIYYNIYE